MGDNNKARWGFCNNIPSQGCQTSDGNDADAAIGIGLKGQATAKEMGAGWTEYFNSNVPNKKAYKKVWLFVENLNINWAPVMKIISTGTTFGFSSKYWTDTRTLNPTSSLSQAKDAKYPAFMNKPFTMIRMCVGVPNKNCVIHTFKKAYKSARELFSAGYIRDTQVDQKGIELAFGAKGHKACGMQRPGFNIQCKDNNKARWGFRNNIPNQGCQTSDGNDADAAIGIGLKGQSTAKEMGAGWTEYFTSNSPNKKKYVKVWLSVAKVNVDWAPVMKIISSGPTFGFSSKYWTDYRTLNPTSALAQMKDAKYSAFMNTPFSTIRMCVGFPNKNCVIRVR